MASRSRKKSIDQHIPELTVTDGSTVFAGINTTSNNNTYNAWYTLPSTNIQVIAPLMLNPGLVHLRHDAAETKQSDEQPPLYYEVPNRRVNGFVGREDILQKIDEALSNGSSPHYAVLQGMGGQGKTQVALEYCYRKKNNPYSAIFWVDATTQDRVEGSFQFISERIKRKAVLYEIYFIMDNIWFSVVEINHPEEGPLLLLEGARKRYPGSFLFRKELGSWR